MRRLCVKIEGRWEIERPSGSKVTGELRHNLHTDVAEYVLLAQEVIDATSSMEGCYVSGRDRYDTRVEWRTEDQRIALVELLSELCYDLGLQKED